MTVSRSLLFLFLTFSVPCWGTMESGFDLSSQQPSLQRSQQKTDKELYLIVGSSRKEGSYINPFAKKIFGDYSIDPTYRSSFGGKATTLDLDRSDIPDAPHIQADARLYKPTAGTVISAVFVELFPSVELPQGQLYARKEKGVDSAEDSAKKEWSKMMLMPEAIRNLAQYMPEEATLEIEHFPLAMLSEMGLYHYSAQLLRKLNPFNGFLSPFFMENLEARNHVGIPNKVAFWDAILGARKPSLGSWEDTVARGIVAEAAGDHPTLLQALSNITNLLPSEKNLQGRLNTEFKIYKADPSTFFQKSFLGSLSELVTAEFTMLKQKDLISAFLERNGFKNVQIERKNNPYNGRNNWVISATRNNQPIPREDK